MTCVSRLKHFKLKEATMVMNEVWYLINFFYVFLIYDKRVVMGNKGRKELKDNWCLVKSVTSDDPVSTISSSVTLLHVDPVEELSDTQRKIKHISTVSDDCEIHKKCKTADMFQFSNEGIWVAELVIYAASAALRVGLQAYCPTAMTNEFKPDFLEPKKIYGRGIRRATAPAMIVMWTTTYVPRQSFGQTILWYYTAIVS